MFASIGLFCFCMAFLVGGYCLGRLTDPRRMWFGFEPDPIHEEPEVVSLEVARHRRAQRLAS